MKTAALQSGMTPGVCPHTRTQCASSVDTAEFAQLIGQLEEERAKNRQLSAKNQQLEEDGRIKDERIGEKDEQLRVKDEQLMTQGKQLIVQSKRLVSQDEQLKAKDELIKRLPEQTASPAKTRKKAKSQKKKTAKPKVATSFKPWDGPNDACFVLDAARVKIWNGEALRDLRLKSGSKADTLLPMLSAGPLRKTEIKETIGTAKTSPYDTVRDVNRLLNEKIKKLNIQKLPLDAAFITCDERTGDYYSVLPIKTMHEFEYG